ncbi:MAG: serine dehydratase subunit alpha family protein [Paludibacteraceae bacterium]|nr:serine dehydratase subunit alpha family protein [Paludibacteraceae bacterium]
MNILSLLNLLHQEVIPAIGCTEPACVALCVARAKEKLGAEPDAIQVFLSKNIYKNALAVGIPDTGMTGLPIAIALGATIGKSEYKLEVLRDTTPEAVEYAKAYMHRVPPQITIDPNAPDILYVRALVSLNNGQSAEAVIQGTHTGTPNDKMVNEKMVNDKIVNFREVYDFSLSVPLKDVQFLMDGAKMNMAAAEKSFMGNYGHGLGRLLHTVSNQHLTNSPHTQMSNIFGDTLFTKILCYTCGACDARMSGAMVPVMSNSGSGNQGISCSIPVYLYALEHNCDEEQTLRALTLSNLTVIYIKQSLGRLSALCGCVVAATGSAVGLTYLMGGQYDEMTFAIKNMIANLSGMICDGAKPACALKVTSGVATAVLSAAMAMHHSFAESTEGIVEEDIDRTIHNLTKIGHDAMSQTDDLIIDIMTQKSC